MENLFRYKKRIYKTTEALAKAIRVSHNGASDSLSDEYVINESYALGEWHYISIDDVINRHNKCVVKNKKLKAKLKNSRRSSEFNHDEFFRVSDYVMDECVNNGIDVEINENLRPSEIVIDNLKNLIG